ncbi:hypothetical protein DFH06DRAFT_254509 [Mycena polygramma]|nr:hypothetical protein DFH06DRAFT_254438 [Mycena polygramma]KAJ7605966.1 hypothetical protein DFH06DRAFT_254509 [Mycena polygramma]
MEITSTFEGYNATDFPRQLPMHPRPAAMWFNATEYYSPNATEEWHSVIPRGHGWVRLGPEKRPFSVSMYHQLHCINGIRRALLLSTSEKTAHVRSHTNHCFNYLRQLLLCRADTTLEPTKIARIPSGQLAASASGETVLHVCRDWVQIRSFVEENSSQWAG